MDASSRSQLVCNSTDPVRHHQRKISELEYKIKETTTALDQGYKIVKVCNTIYRDEPETNCKSTEKSDGGETTKTERCKQTSNPRPFKECKEYPMAINVELEKENLQRHRESLEQANIERNTAYFDCYSRVKPMSAEEAFQYYKSL